MRIQRGSAAPEAKTEVVTRPAIDPNKRLDNPFAINLAVDTVGDLISLWARFNMSAEVLAEAAGDAAANGKKGPFSDSFLDVLEVEPEGKREVWKFLNEKLKASGISPR